MKMTYKASKILKGKYQSEKEIQDNVSLPDAPNVHKEVQNIVLHMVVEDVVRFLDVIKLLAINNFVLDMVEEDDALLRIAKKQLLVALFIAHPMGVGKSVRWKDAKNLPSHLLPIVFAMVEERPVNMTDAGRLLGVDQNFVRVMEVVPIVVFKIVQMLQYRIIFFVASIEDN